MSGAANLVQGTWADAEALIGATIATAEGVDPVSIGDIRRKLEVIGFDCSLHHDEGVAREHGYETVTSPASMARVWAMPAYWSPGQERIGTEALTTPIAAAGVPGEGDTMIATGVRMDYVAPLYPGDRVSSVSVLQSVTQKRTRVGPGAFIVVETTYSNQRGETAAIETVTLLRYQAEETEA